MNKDILWHLINCGLMAALIFFGALVGGHITIDVVLAALIASCVAFLSRFKDYWEGIAPKPAKLGMFVY